jgi:hypothetical protein
MSVAMALPTPAKPIRQPINQCLALMACNPLIHKLGAGSSQKCAVDASAAAGKVLPHTAPG